MRRGMFTSVLCLSLLTAFPAKACTLWAASGAAAANGGSIIMKIRDWKPDHSQAVKMMEPSKGFRYFGLFALGGDSPGLKAGINEKGLVVATATAGSIPAAERKAMPRGRGLAAGLLRDCGSVDDVLRKSDRLVGPAILMIADNSKLATIEIGPEGRFSAVVKDNGIAFHTNHYVEESMLPFNRFIGKSSAGRYRRAAELVSGTPPPYSLADFLAFSNDRNDGPDNSIFRTGSTSRKTRTMAVWAATLPGKGTPELYVRMLDPGMDEQVVRINLGDFFSREGAADK